ncbi:hypothetical protein EU527_01915 [Candidatus Thorarchaeota archaeon]|nr:MAG: hypothetical protein EU527_01915 [Candidatus Thorarchaeota archaeon]
MYDLIVIGSPSFDRVVRDSTFFQDQVLSGPSIISAVTARWLEIENLVVIGSLSSRDFSLLDHKLDTLAVPEFFKIGSPETGGFEVNYNGGIEPSFTRVLGVPKRIGIRDIPDEFLSTRYILLTPLLQEVDAELTEWLCNSSDAIVLMDPQIRTSEAGNRLGTIKELEIASKTTCYLDFIKPNEEEAFFITGVDDPFVAAEILVDTLAENCIITRGTRGSILFDGKELKIIPSFKVNAIDTSGAGAAFLSGFISGLLNDERHDFCAALGASVASFKVIGENTDFSLDRSTALARARELALEIKTH